MRKTAKAAFFLSLASMLLCCTMLVGSTWAWFSDTATVGVNFIVSGELNISLVDENGTPLITEDANGNPIAALSFKEATWSPGGEYTLPEVYVQNTGNLPLVFNISTGVKNRSSLSGLLTFDITNGKARAATQQVLLGPGDLAGPYVVTVTLANTVPTDFMSFKISDIYLRVDAAQTQAPDAEAVTPIDDEPVYNAPIVRPDPDPAPTEDTPVSEPPVEPSYGVLTPGTVAQPQPDITYGILTPGN